MPQEKRKLQELTDSITQPKEDDDGSEKEDTDEEETDDDSVKEEEEEFEDDEPEERVFFTMQFEKPKRPTRIRYRNIKKKAEVQKRDPLPESSVLLDCKFVNVVIDAIYPCEDFVLTNEGIYLVCRLSSTILKELSRGRCDAGVVPSEEQREFALTNQTYNQLTLEKVAAEND
ncbi:unnamed protein product [Rhizophagus irregularis]|nr:unnamed protein product [Rhizophagus irregularis]